MKDKDLIYIVIIFVLMCLLSLALGYIRGLTKGFDSPSADYPSTDYKKLEHTSVLGVPF